MLTVQRAATDRSEVDLLVAQVLAIEEWNRAVRAAALDEGGASSREGRLDLDRRTQARRRMQRAVVDHADRQLREAGAPLRCVAPLRAIVAHRQSWMRETVGKQLSARGLTVVGLLDDGADAVGMAVVEQPDLVLVETRLPSVSGIDAVAKVRRFSPRTVIGCQLNDGDDEDRLLAAGAHGVFARCVPPADVADHLVRCVRGNAPHVVALSAGCTPRLAATR